MVALRRNALCWTIVLGPDVAGFLQKGFSGNPG